ncbi:tetratricopeptide repeat protein [Tepidibacter mesophilus]|uniref:tetratricopeptide repeat protein n=1 Tax=Tepidibacter mesophilus TaxID=655607 RepID=UPI001FA8BC2E|nr:tetratricopeptide repeat protein [Tepidibacter mesophilus]
MKNTYMINNYKNIANKFCEDGNFIKAINFYNKAYELEGGSEDIDLLLDMALAYDDMENYDFAKQKYEEVLSIDENEPRAYFGLGVLYDNKEDYITSIKYYEKAVEIDDKYDRAYFFLASAYDEIGESEQAIKNYNKAIELNPDDFWAYTNLGSLYEEMDENELAYEMTKEGLGIISNHFTALFNMGVILKKLGRESESIKYYEMCIDRDKENPYSYLNLSIIYKGQQKYKKACNVISEGIKNSPETSVLYYNRACFYVRLGMNELALKDLIKAIDLSDKLLEYAKEDEELAPIREMQAYKIMFR